MTHEELTWDVARCVFNAVGQSDKPSAIHAKFTDAANAVLALIAEQLKEPTEAMLAAAFAAARYDEDMKIHREVTQKQYCAMLAASPLVPPKPRE